MKTYLGIEFGSTRIKAVAIDEQYKIVAKGEYGWKSDYINGVWTYSLDEAWKGLNIALKGVCESIDPKNIATMGISGMMHGYLAFDKDWNLLAPFATWQNTITEQASDILSREFNFKMPQRWSACHLYQRILNGEEHVKDVAHITTLAGYIHFMLTGENVIGIGEASGVFPIDCETKNYNKEMLGKFKELSGIDILPLLPKVLLAGEVAGELKNTQIIGGVLPKGIVFAPAEGDMGTGMVATNSVEVGTGNVSAGTSFNLSIVIGKNLSKVYPELDIVTSPTGVNATLVHCNNGTNDINQWFGVLKETAEMFGGNTQDFYTKLFENSLNGDADCGGITVFNYMAGEPISHINNGKPLVVRTPDSKFTLANFIRAQLYGSLATMRLGIDILSGENIEIKQIAGHGGFFKTPGVGQKYMAAACNAPVYCSTSAGEGGPFGMALLSAYVGKKQPLEDFLNEAIGGGDCNIVKPDNQTIDGFLKYMEQFKANLKMQEV